VKGLTRETVDKAAAAIANARGMRRGMPTITNVLDVLPPKLKAEVREDGEDVLKAVGYEELQARAEMWERTARNLWEMLPNLMCDEHKLDPAALDALKVGVL